MSNRLPKLVCIAYRQLLLTARGETLSTGAGFQPPIGEHIASKSGGKIFIASSTIARIGRKG